MPKRKHEHNDTHECPNCHRDRLKRDATGIWECKSCGRKYAGGSFEADTGAVQRLEKAIKEGTEELEEAQERLD